VLAKVNIYQRLWQQGHASSTAGRNHGFCQVVFQGQEQSPPGLLRRRALPPALTFCQRFRLGLALPFRPAFNFELILQKPFVRRSLPHREAAKRPWRSRSQQSGCRFLDCEEEEATLLAAGIIHRPGGR